LVVDQKLEGVITMLREKGSAREKGEQR
jgi:hypothetical protein